MPNDIFSLENPPRYKICVSNLKILSPQPAVPLPLPISVYIPAKWAFWSRQRASSRKVLLDNVFLDCEPGSLLAIIGGSGSGKTTLLNSIAMRIANLKVENGDVNLIPFDQLTPDYSPTKTISLTSGKQFDRSIIGYIRQDDFLLPHLTVIETLNFYASLQLPSDISAATQKQIVDNTLGELGLRDVANTFVGGAFRKGISGGERRRLSIGCALVALPSILILDEPTTGLDSYNAHNILSLLSDLAHKGRSIIISIHQPPSSTFNILDKICIMSSGKVAYCGPRSEALPWFASFGHEPDDKTNPLDFLVDITSIDTRHDENEEKTTNIVHSLIDAWEKKNTSLPNDLSGQQQEQGQQQVEEHNIEAQVFKPPKRPNFFAQTKIVTTRASMNVIRNKAQILGFAAQVILIGVLTGLAFYKPPETPAGIQTLKTLCYQMFAANYYITFILFIYICCHETVIFDRDREDNLYSAAPYVISLIISYLPLNCIFPTIYALIMYFMCGFRQDNLAKNLFISIGANILMQIASQTYAISAVGVYRSFAQASMLANGVIITCLLSAGYLITTVPVYVKWIRWVNPYYYGFNWLVRSQFSDRSFECEGVTGSTLSQCDGDNVLTGLRLQLSTPLYVLPLGLCGYILGTGLVAYLLLRFWRPGGQKASQMQGSSMSNRVQKERIRSRRAVITMDVQLYQLTLTVSPSVVSSYLKSKGKGTSPKVVLDGITTTFKSGKVTAILGPSGAGKTSLLQLIAGRLKSGAFSVFKTQGVVSFSGQEMETNTNHSFVSFCEQSDHWHMPALTVRETLRYAAMLRLHDRSKSEQIWQAEELLRIMGLKNVADVLVGGELIKGISGGEKRRLSIAVALLGDPAILVVDEPTSGLDAYTAMNVMEHLGQVAEAGVTVICSIHAPRSELWETFDSVMLLARGGQLVYSGRRESCLKWFAENGEPCPSGWNPADHLLDRISVHRKTQEDEEKSISRINRLVLARETEFSDLKFQDFMLKNTFADNPPPSVSHRIKATRFFLTFKVLLERSFRNLRRQQEVFVVRIANPPFLALIFWIFFLRMNTNPEGVQNRIGALQENSALPFVGMLAAIAIYPAERNMYFHEYRSPSKPSPATFILSYTALEVPMQIIAGLLYSIIFIYGFGFQSDVKKFFQFFVGIFCLLNTGESIGIFFATWVMNGGLSVSLMSSALTVFSQICGIISVTIPEWLQIIGWATPLKAETYIAAINEFSGLEFNCSQQDIETGICVARTGNEILDSFGMHDRNTAKFTAIAVCLCIIYRLLAWIALYLRTFTL